MSLDNALQFIDALKNNGQMQSAVATATTGKSVDAACAAVAQVATGFGFQFTAADAMQARSADPSALINAAAGELSLEQLDSVAGGAGTVNPGNVMGWW